MNVDLIVANAGQLVTCASGGKPKRGSAMLDLGIIDALVNLTGRAVVGWAAAFRQLQTGYVVNYALTMLIGAVLVVGFLLTR